MAASQKVCVPNAPPRHKPCDLLWGPSLGPLGSKRVLRARSARCERSEPRERSEACSERSDEVRDCKLHITQTKDCT